MTKLTVKGFPEEISQNIEMPNMAELLMYPIFFDTSAEDVYKYGTEFQRYLLDKSPLRNTKKHVSVLSQVRILVPNTRSCTEKPNQQDYKDFEWHIDCEEEGHTYHEARDVVHLLSTGSCQTEFNEHEFEMSYDYENNNIREFLRYLRENKETFPLTPKKMPKNRIVTFENHLHRATEPERPEFRFMFRVVETDRLRASEPFSGDIYTEIYDGNKNEFVKHIERERGKINIYLPNVTKSSMWTKTEE